MPLGVALLVCTLAIGTAPQTRDEALIPDAIDFHVRGSDPLVRAWIANGAAESRTLRGLLAKLAASDIIVHLELVDRIASGGVGQLFFVTTAPTVRYLRIEIVRAGSGADTIALIAHELQHAVEIAGEPRVRDSASMSTFYLGMRDNAAGPGHYDSAAARMTESIVRNEVLARRGAAVDEALLMARLRRSGRPVR